MHARRDEIVARAFGGRLGEDRRLDLEELQLGQRPSRALQQAMAQHQIGLELGPAQVQMAVLEPQLLGRELLPLAASDRDGRRARRPHDAQHGGMHFDLPRLEVGILHIRGARHDLPFYQEDRLHPDRLRRGNRVGRRPRRADRHLHQSVSVTQVEKHDPAQVPAAMHPSAQAHRAPHVRTAQGATTMRPQSRPAHSYEPSASRMAR